MSQEGSRNDSEWSVAIWHCLEERQEKQSVDRTLARRNSGARRLGPHGAGIGNPWNNPGDIVEACSGTRTLGAPETPERWRGRVIRSDDAAKVCGRGLEAFRIS